MVDRQRIALLVSLVSGAIASGFNMFGYPLYVTDEGIYMQQAWSVLREARLSPYTYFYDHAPAGWLALAGGCPCCRINFRPFGGAINTGRVLMVVVHLANAFLLFKLTLRLGGSVWGAILATFLFNLSPLAIFYQRQVLLDNLMTFWILLSFYLATQGIARDGVGFNIARGAADTRVVTAVASGLAFGMAIVTEGELCLFRTGAGVPARRPGRDTVNHRFSLGFSCFATLALVSVYFLYATLKNELFPSGLSFDLANRRPTTCHCCTRSGGSFTAAREVSGRRQSGMAASRSARWLPKDRFR